MEPNSTDSRGFARLDLDDPATMERVLRNGAIWQLPQFWQDGINAIRDGLVPVEECANLPPEVAAMFSDRG